MIYSLFLPEVILSHNYFFRCSRVRHPRTSSMCIQASTHLHTPNWHFPLTRHSETFPFSYMKFVSLEISAWEMRVFAAHYASKNADWNQQQVTDGGILVNRNSANHPYCFLSNQKKVQILAFLYVICERIVSCPPPENRLQRQRERAWSQASGQAFPLLPSPSPFHFFFIFCARSYFRTITRLETLATQATKAYNAS